MNKQDFLNQELFQVDSTNGKVYNRAEEVVSGVRRYLPDNEIWVRMVTNMNLIIRPLPFTNENEGLENVIANNPSTYINYDEWADRYKDPRYLSFGAKLDLNNEDYLGLNSSGLITWKTYTTKIDNKNYYWAKIAFEGPITSIPQEAFSSITTYTIKEIAIPNKVEWIGPKAFTQLGQLQSVIIGTGIKYMNFEENHYFCGGTDGLNPGGSWVFDDVLNLWHITCLAKEAPQTDFFCFSTLEITPSSEAGYNTIYEMSKHYIDGSTIVKDQEGRGVLAPQEGNVNTLTLVEGAVGYDAEHYNSRNNWVNLVGGTVDGQEKPNYGFTKEYCTPQEEEVIKQWRFVTLPKDNRRRYIKILRIYE